MDYDSLRLELINDPLDMGYAEAAITARAAFPEDSGAQDVVVADLLNLFSRVPKSGEVAPQLVISVFTPEEWTASKTFIPSDSTVAQIFDRLMVSTSITVGGETFESALALLINKGTLTTDRANEIRNSLLLTMPKVSRASELGFGNITGSDIANARNIDPVIELGA